MLLHLQHKMCPESIKTQRVGTYTSIQQIMLQLLKLENGQTHYMCTHLAVWPFESY